MERGLSSVRGVFLILFSVASVCSFFHSPQVAKAQVGVIPEGEKPDDFSQVTFKLVGKGCEIHAVRAAVNGLPGVLDSDFDAEKKQAIFYYLPGKVHPEEMRKAIGMKNNECFTAIVKHGQEADGAGPTQGIGNKEDAKGGAKENASAGH